MMHSNTGVYAQTSEDDISVTFNKNSVSVLCTTTPPPNVCIADYIISAASDYTVSGRGSDNYSVSWSVDGGDTFFITTTSPYSTSAPRLWRSGTGGLSYSGTCKITVTDNLDGNNTASDTFLFNTTHTTGSAPTSTPTNTPTNTPTPTPTTRPPTNTPTPTPTTRPPTNTPTPTPTLPPMGRWNAGRPVTGLHPECDPVSGPHLGGACVIGTPDIICRPPGQFNAFQYFCG